MKSLLLALLIFYCFDVFSQDTLTLNQTEVSGMIFSKQITSKDTSYFLLLTSDYCVDKGFYFEVTFTDDTKFIKPILSCGTIYKNDCYDICILYQLTKIDLILFQSKNIASFKSNRLGVRKIDIRESEIFRKQLK